MEFYILNQDLEILAVIDQYKSAIWTRRYYEAGDFELYAPATDALLEILQEGRIVARAEDTTQAGIIERLQITTDAENGNYITASGYTLQGLLNRRIVWKQTTLTGNPEKIIRRLVTENMIDTEEEKRKIPNLSLGEEIGVEGSMRIQYTGDNIQTAVQDICKEYKIGYDITLDLPNKAFIFSIYRGTDRTFGQDENPFVVFSHDFENLLTSDYAADATAAANVAQVAGEGEGTERVKVTVSNTNLGGIHRREIFVDAKDQSSNDGNLTAITYHAMLAQKGADALEEAKPIEEIDGEVEATIQYKLGRDFFLGDLVEILDQYGHERRPRVTEIIESHDDTGESIIPTFAQDN